MKNPTFHDLFLDQLSDMYSAEKQIVEALPKMVKAAQSDELKEAFENHLKETKNQVARLEKAFTMIGVRPKNETCEAMEGILKEGDKIIKEGTASPVKDAALIAAAQRVEHYEMAVYGTLRTFAKQFHYNDVVDLLKETLKEEGNADKTLTSIAEGGFFTSGINDEAEKMQHDLGHKK